MREYFPVFFCFIKISCSKSQNIRILTERDRDGANIDSCRYLKTVTQKPQVEKPVSQKDDGDNKEKVEELAEDKSSEINVISAASVTILCCNMIISHLL